MGVRSIIIRFTAAGSMFVAAMLALALPASAAPCGGNYSFLGQMQRDALAAGVCRRRSPPHSPAFRPDQSVLAFDRRQRGMFHSKSFEDYAAPALSRRASTART